MPAVKAVAFGGGHGLAATLSALRRLTPSVTAVVTVADDGGSSGRLRRELGILPLGDLRMALGALAGEDDEATRWRDLFAHRFGGSGALAGHAVGNLLLAGLAEVLSDPVAALDETCRLLKVSGRVLPMAEEPLEIEAEVAGLDPDPQALRTIRGQVAVATTPGTVRRVRLHPTRPLACADAVKAVGEADLVVLGPGSWFTSVLPHLLVPDLADALVRTPARRLLVLNLAPQPGETAGLSPQQHLQVLSEHAPAGFGVDAVLVDTDAVAARGQLGRAAARLGARAYFDRVASGPGVHDPVALASSIGAVLDDRPRPREEGPEWP